MKKTLFNFYVDENVKRQAIDTLNEELGEQNKGTLAAFLRCCINNLITGDPEMPSLQDIRDEYSYCVKMNKRSRL